MDNKPAAVALNSVAVAAFLGRGLISNACDESRGNHHTQTCRAVESYSQAVASTLRSKGRDYLPIRQGAPWQTFFGHNWLAFSMRRKISQKNAANIWRTQIFVLPL